MVRMFTDSHVLNFVIWKTSTFEKLLFSLLFAKSSLQFITTGAFVYRCDNGESFTYVVTTGAEGEHQCYDL